MKNINKNITISEKLVRVLAILMIAILPIGLFLIVEFGYNVFLSFWSRMTFKALVVNYLWYALLVACVYCIFPHPRIALTVLTVLTVVYATINHFVTEFKGMPITISDIRAMKTAMAVMNDYDYAPDLLLYKSLITAAFVILAIVIFVKPIKVKSKKGKTIKYAAGIASAVCLAIFSRNMSSFVSGVSSSELDIGEMKYAYEVNGYIPVTLGELSTMPGKEPDDYSAQAVESILAQYVGNQAVTEEKPMIIGIMNEAFSDLSALGPIENQAKILDYLYSLKEDPNTIAWGSCLVSIRGTGTANSEFEFLTGNNLRFYGSGCPYTSTSMRGVPNLSANLKSEGYYTIAMHPETASNWRRNGVYPEFGFDDFLSYEDYAGYETISNESDTILNTDDPKKSDGRISDLGDYKKLIDVLEAQEGPAFLFNVTMQNHSGFANLNETVTDNLVDADPVINVDEEARTYETLMAISDDALEYLIEYLRDYDKPVIVVLFGDHQPSLSDSVESALMGKNAQESQLAQNQTKYLTRYFIWSNYDTGIKYDRADIVSANYLGAMVRKAAGLPLTAFEEYLLAQREVIPAMNRFGYLGDDGRWHKYDEENQYSQWIKNNELIQYNAMFDKEENQYLFTVPERRE